VENRIEREKDREKRRRVFHIDVDVRLASFENFLVKKKIVALD